MKSTPGTPSSRAALYAKSKGMAIDKTLGGGYDGLVQSATRRTAIKSFQASELYRRELKVYQRFLERGFFQADKFHVPALVGFDDDLMVVEMTIVSPPFIVDFASVVKLDTPPQFEEEIMEDARREQHENSDEDWPRVRRAMRKLEIIGIYLADVHPGNVRCR